MISVSIIVNIFMIYILFKNLEKFIDPTIKNIEKLIDKRISYWNRRGNK